MLLMHPTIGPPTVTGPHPPPRPSFLPPHPLCVYFSVHVMLAVTLFFHASKVIPVPHQVQMVEPSAACILYTQN